MVFDDTGVIRAYGWKEIPAGRYMIKGVLRSYGETMFVEITEAVLRVENS